MKVWEYGVRHILDDRVEDGIRNDFRLHQSESGVEVVECKYHKPEDKQAFYQCENHSEQLVQPSEHDELDDALKKFSDQAQRNEYRNEDQGKGNHLKNLLGCCEILRKPNANNIGESG